MWRLNTLGGLSLSSGISDAPSGIAAQRRPLALLALLAASGETGLSRDKLLPFLWPESDEERARNALRQLLHTVRRGLDQADLLLGTTDLRLNAAVITSDLVEFEAALARGDLERVAAVYRGPFLDGFHLSAAPEFEYWADARRAEYSARAASALEALAREAARRHDLEAAVRWWRRLATLDPLNGRVASELMSALAASGNPAGALQHARIHETLVREELGAPPDEAVAALARRLRDATPVSRQSPPGTDAAVPLPRPGEAAIGTTGAGSGSAQQLPKLRDRLQAALGDRYVIEQELARREGTTRVFLAWDRRHDRPVAVKLLHPALASTLDRQRFLREIALTARLHHPHIVPLLDSGEAGEQPWYSMPRLDGESLRDRLARDGALPLPDAIEIALEVAEALDYAHREGVVHRDIKPENVFLAEGHAFVTNFGLATALLAAAGPKLTGTGALVGTPAYMSPEQVMGAPVDARSDGYSLACVLYEMVAGQAVHSGPTPQAILARRMRAPAPIAFGAGSPIPDAVAGVLSRAMTPRPEDRLPMPELIARLRGLRGAELERPLTTGVAKGRTGAEPEGPGERPRRHPRIVIWVLGGLALVGLLCAKS